MRISKKETINNIPVLRIRNFFRLLHNDLFETDSLKEFLKINNNEVDELINNLLSQEFIQKNSKRYKLTLKGSALRAVRCVSPINKEKADKILQEFMNRVEWKK
jgi:predicted transcriptional regulator